MESKSHSAPNLSLNFSQKFNEEVVGAIWISRGVLSSSTPHFHEFDYLCNGLLTTFIRENIDTTSHKNFFIGSSFNRPFFLGHIKDDHPRIDKALFEILSLFKATSNENNKVIVMSETKVTCLKPVAQKFPNLSFIY